MDRRQFWVVALLSTTIISLETLWTRIFSAEFFYTFAFLILSFAILGLGLGALALRLYPQLGREESLGTVLLLAALAGLLGPASVLRLGLKFSVLFREPAMVGKFVLTLVILAMPFFLAGVGLAAIFKRGHAEMPRLYMWDLVGAGLGVGLTILAMNTLGVQLVAVLACVPMALAAMLAHRGRMRAAHAATAVLVVVMCVFAGPLLDVGPSKRGPVVYQHWNAMGRVQVHDVRPDYRDIVIDNAAHTPCYRFDGDFGNGLITEEDSFFHFAPLVDGRTGYVLASLGSGGGKEVLQGLFLGAGEIHAVEVNGAINGMLTNGYLEDFSGRIYKNPRVKVVTEDGRAYMRRFRNHFDIILSSSSNSFAALASGAFALSENYLFTTEAFEDYLRALKPHGFLIMEHQFYIPRAVSEVKTALERFGVEDPDRHFAVYDVPGLRRMVILVSPSPLTEKVIQSALGPLTAERYPFIHLAYPPAEKARGNLVDRIVKSGWRSVEPTAPYDISPCSDSRPFVAQMGLMRNVKWTSLEKIVPYEFFGFPVSKLIVLAILAVISLLVLPLLFLPYFFTRGEKLGALPWLYFFCIGIGFMVVEVVLMQQFTLFIGSSAYTFAVILLTLLVASGIGSRFAGRFGALTPFAGVIAWLLLDIALFSRFVDTLGGLTAAPRILLSVAVIFPLGFFMGMPFPKGALRVGERIDWGFAVNGVASVLGSTAILLVSMNGGFGMALGVGAGFYAIAMALSAAGEGWGLAGPSGATA